MEELINNNNMEILLMAGYSVGAFTGAIAVRIYDQYKQLNQYK